MEDGGAVALEVICSPLEGDTAQKKAQVLERLDQLEKRMDDDARLVWSAGLSLGRCLREIQQEKLYRFSHATFKDYCESGRGMSERRAYQLIDFWRTVDSLPEHLRGLMDNEGQARELALVPVDKRAVIIERLKGSGKLTAKMIADARRNGCAVKIWHGKRFGPDENRLAREWNKADAIQQRALIIQLIQSGYVDQIMAALSRSEASEANQIRKLGA